MGIPGLHTYLSRDSNNFKSIQLHNTYLVVDAENYFKTTYRDAKVPFQYGGDYLEFSIHVRTFIEVLRSCLITPIYVFGVGHSEDGIKTDELIKRSEQLFATLSTCSSGTYNFSVCDSSEQEIMPQLPVLVGVQLLRECGVHYIFWERDADKTTAELAAYLKCPVLTNDTDFFMYQSTAAEYCVVPITSLASRSVCTSDCGQKHATSSQCRKLPCKSFQISTSCLRQIPLSLFVLLLGNDSGPAIKNPTEVQQKMRSTLIREMSNRSKRIFAVIQWLSDIPGGYSAALKVILSQLDPLERESANRRIQQLNEDYLLKPDEVGQKVAKVLNLKKDLRDYSTCDGVRSSTNGITVDVPDFNQISERLSKLGIHSIGSVCDGWSEQLVGMFHRGDICGNAVDSLYARKGAVLRVLMEDINQVNSVPAVTELVRQMRCSLLIELERSLGNDKKLCGIKNGEWIETRRSLRQMKRFTLRQIVVNLSETSSLSKILENHLHLTTPKLSMSPEHVLIHYVLQFWTKHSSIFKASGVEFRESSLGLAFLVCALATEFNFSAANDDVISTIMNRYSQCADQAKRQCGSGCSIIIVHQYNELQFIYFELQNLFELITGLKRHYATAKGGSRRSTVPRDDIAVQFMRLSVVFPSGRLVCWISKCLECSSPSKRMDEVLNTWLPRLICKDDGVVKKQFLSLVDSLPREK